MSKLISAGGFHLLSWCWTLERSVEQIYWISFRHACCVTFTGNPIHGQRQARIRTDYRVVILGRSGCIKLIRWTVEWISCGYGFNWIHLVVNRNRCHSLFLLFLFFNTSHIKAQTIIGCNIISPTHLKLLFSYSHSVSSPDNKETKGKVILPASFREAYGWYERERNAELDSACALPLENNRRGMVGYCSAVPWWVLAA